LGLEKGLDVIWETIEIIEDIIMREDTSKSLVNLSFFDFQSSMFKSFLKLKQDLLDRNIDLKVYDINNHENYTKEEIQKINASLKIGVNQIEQRSIVSNWSKEEITIGIKFSCLFLKSFRVGYDYKITYNEIRFSRDDLFAYCFQNKILTIFKLLFEVIIEEVDKQKGLNNV